MNDVIMPAYRVMPDGTRRVVEDSPYEEGMYAGTIGLHRSDNPYPRDAKMLKKLWLRGFNESKGPNS